MDYHFSVMRVSPSFILQLYGVVMSLLCCVDCIVLETGIVSLVAFAGYKAKCSLMECCIDEHIPYDLDKLKSDLESKLFGQPLVHTVVSILEGHKAARNREGHNALAISMHGWPGTGKNYVANMIAHALFKYPNSKYVKWYSGKSSFPRGSVDEKIQLENEISSLVKSCGRALIIFDEVHDIPPGVLDVVKPMLDFHREYKGVSYKDAVFLFLCNLDGNEITNHFISLNKPRDEMTFADYESVIRKKSYIEKGGFEESRLLYSHLIDHFIPFLPLEQNHVEKCIVEEFKSWNVYHIKQEYIDAAMSVITFGPENNPIFSNGGCKRIRNQVAFLIKHLNIPYRVDKPTENMFQTAIRKIW